MGIVIPYPRRHRPAAERQVRAELTDIIERALALLDEMDGDADLEDGADAEQPDHHQEQTR